MKRKTLGKLFIACLLLSAQTGFAQNSPFEIWGGGLDGSTYQRFSIYSELPYGVIFEAPLDAAGNRLPVEFNWRGGGQNTALKILPNKNIGIGTANPVSKLDVNGSINLTAGENLTWGGAYGPDIPTIASTINAGINFYPSGSTLGAAVRINRNGNLLVGKTDQVNTAYKVDVNGKIHANEIVVNTTGADFVFEKGYNLRPIAELEKFIKSNKHLPEIPAAKEMTENGVNLGDLNIKLLQKIEELTLHLIEKDKEIKAQHLIIKNYGERLNKIENKQQLYKTKKHIIRK